MTLQCFVFDGESDTFDAMLRCPAKWIAAISSRAMWGQRDWYPRLLAAVSDDYEMLVPVTNEPAPDWQAAGPPSDDMLIQRRIAGRCEGSVVDVTDEVETAVPYVAIVRQRHVGWTLSDGFELAHESARILGRVGLVSSVYAVHL